MTLAAAALLAGCGGSDDDQTTTEPRVPGPTDTIVVYERVGGIAGIREHLRVRPDGAARLETSGATLKVRRFQLSEDELNGLRGARDGVDFAAVESEYGPKQPVADGFATTVTADGRAVTVLTEGVPPPELERLIDICAGIVEGHVPR